MALWRQVLQNEESKKWAFCETSDEDTNYIVIIGDKEFDTEQEAGDWMREFLDLEIAAEAERRELNMPLITFGEAIELLKAGKKVLRIGWNGKGMWLALVKSTRYQVDGLDLPLNHAATDGNVQNLLPWIGMKTADNMFVPWLASQTDILSSDWIDYDLIEIWDKSRSIINSNPGKIYSEEEQTKNEFNTAEKDETMKAIEEETTHGYGQKSFMQDTLKPPVPVTEVYKRLSPIISDKLGVDIDEVTLGTKLENDLGADMLDVVELSMEAEKEFDIHIPDNIMDVAGKMTVGEFCAAVAQVINN